MILDREYERRMASLVRAEAGRSGERHVPTLASVALARRLQARRKNVGEKAGAVDPIAASIPDAEPLLLRH